MSTTGAEGEGSGPWDRAQTPGRKDILSPPPLFPSSPFNTGPVVLGRNELLLGDLRLPPSFLWVVLEQPNPSTCPAVLPNLPSGSEIAFLPNDPSSAHSGKQPQALGAVSIPIPLVGLVRGFGPHQGLRPSLAAYWSKTTKQMFFFGLQSKEAWVEFLNLLEMHLL